MRPKNVEHCIKIIELLIRHTSDSLTFDARSWYEKSDSTDLRIQIINVLCEATKRSMEEGAHVDRITRQKRNTCKSASVTN